MPAEAANNAVVLNELNFASATRGVPRASREVLRFVLGLSAGSIRITLPDGRIFAVETGKTGPQAEIRIRQWRFARRVMFAGDVGLGDSYGDGDWDSPDITEVVKLFASNEDLTANFLARSPVARLAFQLRHFLNRNTKTGSQRNISAHYDLGNAFYSEWLDRSMTYSSAIFAPGDNDLSSAQERKYRALANSMGVQPDEHVLEIGCGWGGFAEFLAKERGARVTALTISREQFEFAQRRMQEAGLNERVTIRFQDYRDEHGTYDRIGSIEMFEAVGESYWGTYFTTLRDRLKSGGTAGLQIITVADRFFEDYRRNIDFIRRFIFPGGMLPSPIKLGELSRAYGLIESSDRSIRHDYAETLRQWRSSFDEAWPRLQPMGFDERFRRLWRYYLSYCEGGFEVGSIDVHQLVYRKG
ncbi:MAG: class I SAM-dependent methyltransferase [Rhabdaerophilum sp.]